LHGLDRMRAQQTRGFSPFYVMLYHGGHLDYPSAP
jgi:hypothetical protein